MQISRLHVAFTVGLVVDIALLAGVLLLVSKTGWHPAAKAAAAALCAAWIAYDIDYGLKRLRGGRR